MLTQSAIQVHLRQYQSNPLRTKMVTTGTLYALQEMLTLWITKDYNKHGHYFTSRVPKMAAYGTFINAPLGHFLNCILQKVISDRTSLKAKIIRILACYKDQLGRLGCHSCLRAEFPFPSRHGFPLSKIVAFGIRTYIGSVAKRKRIAGLRRGLKKVNRGDRVNYQDAPNNCEIGN
ncbi:hypothetical protein OIDMADRAFT_109919 [Oidiodendron maius Zn]|uniref:Uncharacterized protein n=1 Tax=Oidiodendron maius (strain Zn) TaxID=913774 RepID=A0A0C3HUT9_OIDMZ|nr:hypothetical protein OIDMADRAFT_109919 [Oidiodendron maius Zn]